MVLPKSAPMSFRLFIVVFMLSIGSNVVVYVSLTVVP